ncbi:hypothetical protein EJ04DRAFT_590275 [Polyplosphaeria fusca]|uniref:DUF6594 domain-containing protein n=1 Tax=Polyplosphaeria fusca TaxID=682080 RepID=A0A9P4QNG6_9PLEO|nr:hypothetical protein EJ04DRAFT_590275 [Polyplosphaeria fusca]
MNPSVQNCTYPHPSPANRPLPHNSLAQQQVPLRGPQQHPQPQNPFGQSNRNQNTQQWTDEQKSGMPWKFQGYKILSKWMASDDDFFVVRRFQSLNAHTLLYMQDRLVQYEDQLNTIHDNVEAKNEKHSNGSFRRDLIHEPRRDQILCELSSLLHYYNQYIDTFSRIRQRPRADKRQLQNLANELDLKIGMIDKKEAQFASHHADLMSISPTSVSPLVRFLDTVFGLIGGRGIRVKRDEESQILDDGARYASNSALSNLSTGCIIFLGWVMLLGPLWWLEFVNKSVYRLAIITGFMALFMVMMSAATVHRPFEVVAASAAYAAVLMVFMQIGGS